MPRFTFWGNRRYYCEVEAADEETARNLAEEEGDWEPCEPDWDGVGVGCSTLEIDEEVEEERDD